VSRRKREQRPRPERELRTTEPSVFKLTSTGAGMASAAAGSAAAQNVLCHPLVCTARRRGALSKHRSKVKTAETAPPFGNTASSIYEANSIHVEMLQSRSFDSARRQ